MNSENFTDEKVDDLIKHIIGKNWHLSPLTETFPYTDPFTCYQEWDLHLDEITEGVQTSHLKKSFTLYYFSHGTVEIQMITILNILNKEIESKKFVGKLELYKSY